MCRDYYLHKRKNGFYYVEFIDKVTGSKLSARSTGETEKNKAIAKAEFWLLNGVPSGRLKKPRPIEQAAGIEAVIKAIRKAELNSDDALRVVKTLKDMGLIDIAAVKNTGAGAVKFIDYLKAFWDFDKSEYIKNRLSHGKRIGRSHAHQCMLKVNSVLTEFFGDKKLNCVTTDDLEKLAKSLYERGLSTSTTNQIMLCAETPIKWAYTRKIIPSNPCIGLDKFKIENKERGILTEKEAAAVFAVDWKDKRAYVGSLVSATTGARQGEILALRLSDIGTDTLNIAHNYTRHDGLKCPKNEHKRKAPLLPEVRAALLDLLNDNPHSGIDDPFLFYSLSSDKPCDCKVLLDGLREVLEKVGIDWKTRNITFHSWRHWFCSKITEVIDGEKVAKVSGHLSHGVFKKYADHIETANIKAVGNAAAQAFGNVLQFPIKKAV